jgi:hypothetical protein
MAAKKINKDFFLLVKIYESKVIETYDGDNKEQEEYLNDLFDEYVELYYDFLSSEFNDENKPKIECIREYINSILN